MKSGSTFTSLFCAQEFVKRSTSKRWQLLRFLMPVERRVLFDAPVDGFNTSPDFEPSDTTQNIVEIPTVRELVICLGHVVVRDSFPQSVGLEGKDKKKNASSTRNNMFLVQ